MLRSRFLWQLYGAFGLTILVCTLIFGFFTSSQVQKDARQQVHAGLLAEAAILRLMFTDDLVNSTPIKMQKVTELFEKSQTRVTVIDQQGVVLADNRESPSLMDNHSQRPEIIQARLSGVGDSERYSKTVGKNLLYVALRIESANATLGYVRVAVPMKAVEAQLAGLRNQILISVLVITGLFLVFGFFLTMIFTRPIIEITGIATRMADGELSLRLARFRRDEIGELGAALNNLAQGAEDRIVALTNSRDEIAAVLSGLNEGVIAVDPKQRIVHINSAARQMLNLERHDLAGLPLWELVRDSELCDAVDACMSEQNNVNGVVKREGRTLGLSVLLMRNQTMNSPIGAIVVLENVTEVMRLQQIRTDFVANASHELKTPIAAIRGFAETIIDDPGMEDDIRLHFIDRIRSQAARLDNIVQDLIQLSRVDSPVKVQLDSDINLSSLLQQVFKAKSEDAVDSGVIMDIDVPTVPVIVKGERGALDQMVSNLLENAIKYSRQIDGQVHLRLAVQADVAIIEIEDDGIGIPAEEQQRIFERFYRVDRARSREQGGTGLGLSIVKHVAQSHRGSVSVTSKIGAGSIFVVRLPIARSGQSASSPAVGG
jgi:two-component system phosphate regulon sensor histidine kinase PhoR